MRYPKVHTSNIDRIKAAYHRAKMQEDFWEYRKEMNPGMKEGWFQERLAGELQGFYDAFDAGERPRLLVATPPQHGKSLTAIDFLSWVAGKKPDCREIFTSYSDRLGIRANLRLQRQFDSEKYQDIFSDTRIASKGERGGIRTRNMLEYLGHEGYFRNTTTGGPINGESLDLSVIDDPVKSREEANSPAMRDKLWAWFTDDLFTRFSEDSALLLIMTRWHVDDIAGRLIEAGDFKVVSFPAIAEVDDPKGKRKAGEPLFPEHKSIGFLNERKKIMISTSWEALYQQNPVVQEGDIIKAEQIKIVTNVPGVIKESVRYWDKAGTEGGGAYTAGVLMHKLTDGKYNIADVIRGQWSAGRREAIIKQTAEADGAGVRVWVEQEPGSGGKESAENTVINLAGFVIKVERVTGSKVTRAEPFAAQVENGNVSILNKEWTKPFIDEARLFPNGKYKDQIDGAGGAFNKLTVGVRTDGIIDFYKEEVEALRERQKSGMR